MGSASAGEVAEDLKSTRDWAYTTVSTTLDRLYKKGLLVRQAVPGQKSLKYIYSYSNDLDLQRRIVNSAVDKLVMAFGSSVVSTIYGRLDEISPEEVEALKEMVDKKKRRSAR